MKFKHIDTLKDALSYAYTLGQRAYLDRYSRVKSCGHLCRLDRLKYDFTHDRDAIIWEFNRGYYSVDDSANNQCDESIQEV